MAETSTSAREIMRPAGRVDALQEEVRGGAEFIVVYGRLFHRYMRNLSWSEGSSIQQSVATGGAGFLRNPNPVTLVLGLIGLLIGAAQQRAGASSRVVRLLAAYTLIHKSCGFAVVQSPSSQASPFEARFEGGWWPGLWSAVLWKKTRGLLTLCRIIVGGFTTFFALILLDSCVLNS